MAGVKRSTSGPEAILRIVRRRIRTARGYARVSFCLRVCLAAGVLTACTTGCTPTESEINAFIHPWEASVSASEYRVLPPDTITISSPNAPEVDGESQAIRQDGKVTLRLIGEVKVAGKTPVEIARKLESLLQQYYVDPQVSVYVSGQASKRFYVFGMVAGAGPYPYTGRDTLLHVLSRAQPTYMAWKSRVKVIHPSHEEEKRRVITVNADRLVKEGRLDQDVLLQEGDIVYVPPTPLAWVALRLQEVLGPLAPIAGTVRGPTDLMTLSGNGSGTGFGGS